MEWNRLARNVSFLVLAFAAVMFMQRRAEANSWGNCADASGAYCSSVSLGHCGPYNYEAGCGDLIGTASSYMSSYNLGNGIDCYYVYREGDFTDPAYYSGWFQITSC